MNKHLLLPLISSLVMTTTCPTLFAVKRPNIIMILVDDLGYADLSCQGYAKDIHTPNIDKLLNEGVRFTNFHANCPVCSPSRAALLSGRFPDMVGVPGVIRSDENDTWGYLSPGVPLLPKMMKTQGYNTAIVGKWHLGLYSPNLPNERGFDYFYGFLGDMMDDYYTHLREGHNYMRENTDTIDSPHQHATDLFTAKAIQYIDKQIDAKHPYFLYLAYNAPHTPIQPPEDWLKRVKTREPHISDTRARLVALIEHLDANIGEVYNYLDAKGQLENTLIVFASDNGGDADAGANNLPYRGAKQDMYEGGIRVPAGAYWKGRINPKVNDHMVMLSDLLPTFCDLVGAPVTTPVDGVSIFPLLMGKDQNTSSRSVYWVRREGNPHYGGLAYYAAQCGDYKILQNTPYEPIQFFDIKNDPQEQHPILDRHSEEYIHLFEGLTNHIRKSGAIPWQK